VDLKNEILDGWGMWRAWKEKTIMTALREEEKSYSRDGVQLCCVVADLFGARSFVAKGW
jgi:hypothetical protein